jgi:nitroimidazol reductase NimA-like FMN-containing flavoprotein (pyridoxamine 5'-phosphate oxidase superfamily)
MSARDSQPTSSAASAHTGAARMTVLERAECLQLLAQTRFGRLAVGMSDGTPAIRPVNYAFDQHSQSVVFRTGRGSKLHGLLLAGRAAFEIDGTDPEARTGWSVIISGVCEEVHTPSEIERLTELGVEPWAPGEKPLFVRLHAFTVSGRRLVRDEQSGKR